MLSPIKMLDQKRGSIYVINIPESEVKSICPLCNGSEENEDIDSDKFYELELNPLCAHSLDDGKELKFIRSDYTQVDVILTLNLRKILKKVHPKAICIHYSNGCKKIGTVKSIFFHQKICIYNTKVKKAFLIAKFTKKKFIKKKLLIFKIVNNQSKKNYVRKMLRYHLFLNNKYFNKIIQIIFKLYHFTFFELSYYLRVFKNINVLYIKYGHSDYYQQIKPYLEAIPALETLRIGKGMKNPHPYAIIWDQLENLPSFSKRLQSLEIEIEEPLLLAYINKYIKWLLENNNILSSFTLINKTRYFDIPFSKENVEQLFYLLNKMKLLREVSFIHIECSEFNFQNLIDSQSHIENLCLKTYNGIASLALSYTIIDKYYKTRNYNIEQISFINSDPYLYWVFNLVGHLGKINKIKILTINWQIQIKLIGEIIDSNYLEELYLSNFELHEDDGLSFILKLMYCKKLRILHLSFRLFLLRNSLTSSYLFMQKMFIQRFIDSLITLTSLQKVALNGVYLNNETSSDFLNLIQKSNTIKILEIKFRYLFDDQAIAMVLLDNLKKALSNKEGLSGQFSHYES